jgi:hypothetical protein
MRSRWSRIWWSNITPAEPARTARVITLVGLTPPAKNLNFGVGANSFELPYAKFGAF